MHFFYLDESGCSGADLAGQQEPIFVLGGLSVKDQGWVETTRQYKQTLLRYFAPDPLPGNFELHAHELLSPMGEGPFAGHERERRNQLAFDLLDLITQRSHKTHFVAFAKGDIDRAVAANACDLFDAKIPYLLAYNYLVTYIEAQCKESLGHTARAMIIMDVKDQFSESINSVTRFRRFEAPAVHRLKWLVEFSYPIDSRHHPMIQLSDLVIFCTRKFFEMDRGHRPAWSAPARSFYAGAFDKVHSRLWRKTLIEQGGRFARDLNEAMQACFIAPQRNWRQIYGLIQQAA